MYKLQIFIDRQQTQAFKLTQSNQQALDQMMAHIANNPGAGWGELRVAGATYGASLFPQWMSDALAANLPELNYDPVNFQFYCDFEKVQDAQAGALWLQQFKAWAMANGATPEDRDIATGLDSRIMDASDESLAGLEF